MKLDIGKPAFIVFEGIDGSGKTTVSMALKQYLIEKGFDVDWFREPGDSVWGKKIRKLANETDSIPIEEELNYFIEDRRLDIKHNIKPALAKHRIVILDRYYYSNVCYQGARGLDKAEILKKNLQFAPVPDLAFIIDIPVETALDRIRRGRDDNAVLFETRDFLTQVRQNYLTLNLPEIVVIDGDAVETVVFDRVKNVLF